MATHYYNEAANYPVTGAQDVKISVISGNGQGGGIVILKGSEFLGANETVNAGTAASCKGQDFKIVVTIQDKLNSTNWTGVIVVVSQGSKDEKFSFAHELPAHLDIACYVIELKMS